MAKLTTELLGTMIDDAKDSDFPFDKIVVRFDFYVTRGKHCNKRHEYSYVETTDSWLFNVSIEYLNSDSVQQGSEKVLFDEELKREILNKINHKDLDISLK